MGLESPGGRNGEPVDDLDRTPHFLMLESQIQSPRFAPGRLGYLRLA